MQVMLDHILQAAESRFGPRCEGWEFQGVRFYSGHPTMGYLGDSAVAIYLGDECRTDPDHATYQLAHEAIHLLGAGRTDTTVLEEGLATEFATAYLLDTRGVLHVPGLDSYGAAMRLYQQLQRIDYHAVRKMREEQPVISLIDTDLLKRYCPRLDSQTAAQLTGRFVI